MVNYLGAEPEDLTMARPRPLTYPEIATAIAAKIESGEYPPGSMIPSHRQTAEMYDVSQSTANRAIGRLRVQRYVEKWTGLGNVVRPPEDWRPLADDEDT